MEFEKILEVKNLCTSFFTEEGEIKAVDDVSFEVYKGKTLGIVGESGCGKSVTGLSLMRLISTPYGKIVRGQVLYHKNNVWRNLLAIESEEMRSMRGNEIAMIFQEAMTSLNPVFTIGNQLCETIQLHQLGHQRNQEGKSKGLSKKEIYHKAIEVLRAVRIPDAEKCMSDYPHQLSGGMRQRVMIAMALSCHPRVLIADEPTASLDVATQGQILALLRELQAEMGMALILITHDLGVLSTMADEVVVMYAGQVVEKGSVQDIFESPKMPYTQGLLNSVPKLGKRLEPIPGMVPHLLHLPPGCRFQDRCKYVEEKCRFNMPELRPVQSKADGAQSHLSRCIRSL